MIDEQIIAFEIPGKPMGKGRPRFTQRGFVYTPQTTASYENMVKVCFEQEAAKKGWKRIESGPVLVMITAAFEIPKSASHKLQAMMETGELLPTKKPDFDNIGKIICDSLNGLAYHDDSQIVDCHIQKLYDKDPKVIVLIAEKIKGDNA